MGVLGAQKLLIFLLKKIISAVWFSLLRYSTTSKLQPSVVMDTGNNILV